MTLKIDFENQILALFDGYFWPFNKSHKKNQIHFCDQCNHTFNLKCFYQISLTWWKTYGWSSNKLLSSKKRLRGGVTLGCPTTYSCHVDSVLLNSKFEANRSEYWNSKFKYSQIEYSNIFRRTWCFQISFLIFEDSKIGRWHFPSLHS